MRFGLAGVLVQQRIRAPVILTPAAVARPPVNADDPTTYFGGGEKGYRDYPSLAHERGEQPKPCVDVRWR
jgi:hypothetical protein